MPLHHKLQWDGRYNLSDMGFTVLARLLRTRVLMNRHALRLKRNRTFLPQ